MAAKRYSRITKATSSNVDEIVALNQQFHRSTPGFQWDKAPWILEQIEQGNYYILNDSKGIAGAFCLEVMPHHKLATIETIAIRPDLKGTGLGKKLINHAVDIGQSLSLGRLTVASFREYGLEGFYKKCGFKQLPTGPGAANQFVMDVPDKHLARRSQKNTQR